MVTHDKSVQVSMFTGKTCSEKIKSQSGTNVPYVEFSYIAPRILKIHAALKFLLHAVCQHLHPKDTQGNTLLRAQLQEYITHFS